MKRVKKVKVKRVESLKRPLLVKRWNSLTTHMSYPEGWREFYSR
jgi:hypothetical protein